MTRDWLLCAIALGAMALPFLYEPNNAERWDSLSVIFALGLASGVYRSRPARSTSNAPDAGQSARRPRSRGQLGARLRGPAPDLARVVDGSHAVGHGSSVTDPASQQVAEEGGRLSAPSARRTGHRPPPRTRAPARRRRAGRAPPGPGRCGPPAAGPRRCAGSPEQHHDPALGAGRGQLGGGRAQGVGQLGHAVPAQREDPVDDRGRRGPAPCRCRSVRTSPANAITRVLGRRPQRAGGRHGRGHREPLAAHRAEASTSRHSARSWRPQSRARPARRGRPVAARRAR